MLTMTRPVKLVKTKPGGPGSIETVSMFVGPAVTIELRTKHGGPGGIRTVPLVTRHGGLGGIAKGRAATSVWLLASTHAARRSSCGSSWRAAQCCS